jgi:hypothetical protein
VRGGENVKIGFRELAIDVQVATLSNKRSTGIGPAKEIGRLFI